MTVLARSTSAIFSTCSLGYLVGYFDFEAFPLANIGDAFDADAS